MEIQEFQNYLTEEKSYQILIAEIDKLNSEEISLCFLNQYPKIKATLCCSENKDGKIIFKIIVLGLNLTLLNK